MRISIIISLLIILIAFQFTAYAQNSIHKKQNSKNYKVYEIIIKDRLKFTLPKQGKLLTYGYFVDSLKNYNVSENSILYGNSYRYYKVDDIYVAISLGKYGKAHTWEMVVNYMGGYSKPIQSKEFQVRQINGKNIIIKKFSSGSIYLISVDADGIANVSAQIYYKQNDIEKAYAEAERIAETFEFIPPKPNLNKLIKIKDLISFEIPQEAKQLNFDEYIRRKKELGYRVGVDPNFDRMAYYEYDDLIVFISSMKREKSTNFNELVKLIESQKKDYSIHSFSGQKVVVSHFESLNTLNVSGIDPKGLVSYHVVIYFKPESKLNLINEMERLVRSIKFQ